MVKSTRAGDSQGDNSEVFLSPQTDKSKTKNDELEIEWPLDHSRFAREEKSPRMDRAPLKASFEINGHNDMTNSTEAEIEINIDIENNPEQEKGYAKLGKLFHDHPDLNFQTTESFHGGPSSRGKGYRLAFFSWMASAIDILILFSLSCVFLLTFSLLVNDSLKDILHVFGGSFLNIFTVVWLSFSALYMVMLRSFLGYSIGEWACGLRLGSVKQRLGRNYIFKVIFRVTLVFATGVIVLPVLSLLTGKDLAGKVSGIPLISVPN